ncbi:hypothetical protein N9E21_01365 [Candidatus Poseidoniaceae archaeon]|nr:hypothetical protein [Candidatus Poseidoniaceae archaeon]
MITFDALETIQEDKVPSVVAIGSSITRASIDGNCIEDLSSIDDLEVYNLGLSGAIPYTELMQLTALVDSKTDIVLLETGVNSFWDLDVQEKEFGSDTPAYIEFRMKLNSIQMKDGDFGDWTDIIRDEHRQFLLDDVFSRVDEYSTYSSEAIEELLTRILLNESAAIDPTSWLHAPQTNDESWNNYLSTPNYRVGAWENNSTLRNPEAWFQENMEHYSEYGEYTPQHNGTLFHVTLNHMVEELIRNDVKVVLVAAPRNPMIFEYLEPGQTDGLNSSLLDLKLSDDVFVENMFWDEWGAHDFLDRNHLNGDGREKMCGILAPMIDSILIGD